MNKSGKKYFTLSFDDGITQDLTVLEILKKYGFYCASFNINTGLCGVSWDWVANAVGKPGLSHRRFTMDELKSGIYDGFELLCHTCSHTSIKIYDDDPSFIVNEFEKNADDIYGINGVRPIGMAWPGGDTEYTDITVKNVYEYTTMKFGRCSTPTYSFSLPEMFLKWYPTCSIMDKKALKLTKEFVKAKPEEDMLLYLWCHSYEFDAFDSFDRLEKILKLINKDDSIIRVTNTEFYNIFKDRIPSFIAD